MEKIERLRSEGAYKVERFQKDFPQGSNLEFYHLAMNIILCRCDVPNEAIKYLAMYRIGFVKIYMAEVDLTLDTNYNFVYNRKKKHFFCVPMTKLQKFMQKSLPGMDTNYHK